MTTREKLESALRLERGNIDHSRIRINGMIDKIGELHRKAAEEAWKPEPERQYFWIDSLAGVLRNLEFEQASMKRSHEMANIFASLLANIE